MLSICHGDQRFVKEDLLGLPERDAMEIPILLEISIVPIEPGAALEGILCHDAD
jgi:hypothetical protein